MVVVDRRDAIPAMITGALRAARLPVVDIGAGLRVCSTICDSQSMNPKIQRNFQIFSYGGFSDFHLFNNLFKATLTVTTLATN